MNKMSKCTVAMAVALLVSTGGCSTLAPVAVEPFPMRWETTEQGELQFCKIREQPGLVGRTANTVFGRGRAADTDKTPCLDTASITTKAARNDLQHSLLGMATGLCREFRKELYQQTLEPIYMRATGSLAEVASVSLIPHEATARAVGSASDVIGMVAGDLDGYFRETKMSIALSGIELARTRLFKQIIRSAEEDLQKYPVGRAINDAMRYHAVCTLADGLRESAGAVEAATNE